MKYIGIDGCKAGWIAWIVSGNEPPEFKVVKTLDELLDDLTGATTLIDMPIGFSDSQTPDRLCDKAARRFLTSKRGSSVFLFRAERRFTKPITLRRVMPMLSSLIRSFLNRLGDCAQDPRA